MSHHDMTAPLASLPIVVVDAFASRPFTGNPAAVVDFGDAPFVPDAVLQSIAQENNLAETAFVRVVDAASARFHLRWFTPEHEINLCGHATLATAHALFERSVVPASVQVITFDSKSGPLSVARLADGALQLDFPAWMPAAVVTADVPDAVLLAFGLATSDVMWAGKNRDWTLVLRGGPAAVKSLAVDLRALDQIKDAVVVIVAAFGDGSTHLPASSTVPDFVCRAFCPNCSVPEDPVCGSAHCSLIPYFARALGQDVLVSNQVSRRGGELRCALVNGGARVNIAGTAVTYLQGRIAVPSTPPLPPPLPPADMFIAHIVSVSNETENVRRLALRVSDAMRTFSFRAGQWVDFVPHALPECTGGYSICNSPLDDAFVRERVIELAVQQSRHPVAAWVHSSACCAGAAVSLRVGGAVFFNMQQHATLTPSLPRSLSSTVRPALFIAAGVGITPLLSMFRHVADLHRQHQHNAPASEDMPLPRCALLYSATHRDRLLFRAELERIASTLGPSAATVQFFCTRDADAEPVARSRRIAATDMHDALASLNTLPADAIVYTCGPPQFMDAVQRDALALGCLPEHIVLEKWW